MGDLPFPSITSQMFYTMTGVHLRSVSMIVPDWGGHTHLSIKGLTVASAHQSTDL